MELLEGQTLKQRLDVQRKPWPRYGGRWSWTRSIRSTTRC
jgi:hypothetical protein